MSGEPCGLRSTLKPVSLLEASTQVRTDCPTPSAAAKPQCRQQAQRDGDDGDDGDSSGDDCRSGSEDSLDERDKRRAKKRRESSNSLGTPNTKSRSKAPLASPAPAKPIEGDRPSLVLLGDEDLAMWKSGLRKYKMGFHWESYLYHKQQYDNYDDHKSV